MDRGVMDRFLASPTSRAGLMSSTLVYQAILTLIQSLVVVAIAWFAGARFHGGFVGIVVLLLGAMLLTAAFSAFSNAVALLSRQQTALIGISQLVTLPLMFLSSAIMNTALSPAWVRDVARYNPFEWAVVVGRQALTASPDWGTIWLHLGLLAVLTLVMTNLATRAFRAYQRSA
jgi:ABC-2 type transport system permease protein